MNEKRFHLLLQLMRETNLFRVKGSINKIEITKRAVKYTIATDGGNGRSERLEFVDIAPRDVVTKKIPFNIKDRVTLEGHIQDRRFVDRKMGNKRYEKSFVIDNIEHTKRLLLEKFEDIELSTEGGYPQDENHVLIVGVVTHVYQPTSTVTILTVRVGDGEFYNYCDVICYKKQAETAAKLKEGDYALTVGYMTISHSNKTNKDVQVVTCKDIARVAPEKIEKN